MRSAAVRVTTLSPGGAENRTSIDGVACLYPIPAEREYAPILIGRPHDTRPFNSQASAPGLL